MSLRTLALASMLLGGACSSTTGVSPKGGQPTALTTLPRALSAGEASTVSSANAFTFSLFRQVVTTAPADNAFASPLSASYALGMAMNGANGSTFSAMRASLEFPATMDRQAIGESWSTLTALLTSLDPSTDVRVANSIWWRQQFPFSQAFIDEDKRWFGAEAKALDFGSAQAVPTINGWVSTATNGKIPTIVESIPGDAVMFLINALYFKGSWRDKFDVSRTTDAPFTTQSGALQVRMMHRSGQVSYAEGSTWQAVELPYGNAAWNMTVLLPKAGTTANALVASLDAPAFAAIVGAMRERAVSLSLPKLRLEWERELGPDLTALGMGVAFSDAADFSRMSPSVPVQISSVKQKTFVQVDEEGTEAAAATSVTVVLTSAPQFVDVTVDRPFVLVIRERLSGTILFIGRIGSIP
ncbi:MAG: proteinase inhibitor serpin [Gemmatimonadetes bacterium]|nr:proteinase inhibitor serpin [Gemmatimonadota bacterium]